MRSQGTTESDLFKHCGISSVEWIGLKNQNDCCIVGYVVMSFASESSLFYSISIVLDAGQKTFHFRFQWLPKHLTLSYNNIWNGKLQNWLALLHIIQSSLLHFQLVRVSRP